MLRNKIQGLEATDPDFPQLSLAERRQKLRVRTYIRLQVIRGEELASAIVTDLSLDGMRLRTNQELAEGDQVEVKFLDSIEDGSSASIRCQVVWAISFGPPGRTTYEAGLSFSDPSFDNSRSWVNYVLDQLGFDQSKTFQKRRYLRANGEVPARIFTHTSDESLAGEVVNLGIGGALLSAKQALVKDSQIHCEICLWRILPALRLPCRVLAVREDEDFDGDETRYLHSLLFLGVDTEQVKLLGNYVIYLINQSD